MKHYIAVDIGGTQLRAACYPETGLEPVLIKKASTQDHNQPLPAENSLKRLAELISSVWPKDGKVKTISLAAPGPVNPYTGILLEAPNIPGWVNMPLRQIIQDRFNVPVLVGNDANLAALGEWKFGAGQGHHNLIYMTISTGIGSGIIINDQLLLGTQGLAAELGHVTVIPEGPMCGCGHPGHLEAVASGTAIAKWVQEQINQGKESSLAKHEEISTKVIAKAARQGDLLSIAAFERSGGFLGLALANYLHIFNPSAIVLGGGVARSGSLLLDPLKKTLQQDIINEKYLENLLLTTAAFGDEVGLVGALALGRSVYPATTSHHE